MEELRVIVEDLTALRADVLRNERRPSAEAIAQRLSAICDRLTVIVVEHGATPLSGDPGAQVEYPPAGMVSSPAAEGARVIGSIPTGTYAPGETFPIMPLTEGDGHVQSDELGRVEETRGGVPSGGGSADDHPRGGDSSRAEAAAGGPTDAAQAGDRAAADGEGADPLEAARQRERAT